MIIILIDLLKGIKKQTTSVFIASKSRVEEEFEELVRKQGDF
ncbi:MAG: hypothetical protein SAK29_36615 [Scytonema sp. PMC 1069.18]|nr:hypothetical protein [Scytonema sp. PMC 1069.18]MEC4881487.1 hypothetical protein [Scytonema sp. PMC 1070.18]